MPLKCLRMQSVHSFTRLYFKSFHNTNFLFWFSLYDLCLSCQIPVSSSCDQIIKVFPSFQRPVLKNNYIWAISSCIFYLPYLAFKISFHLHIDLLYPTRSQPPPGEISLSNFTALSSFILFLFANDFHLIAKLNQVFKQPQFFISPWKNKENLISQSCGLPVRSIWLCFSYPFTLIILSFIFW